MTGYGIASADFKDTKYTVEIRSLNSKFLELNIKLPKSLNDKELILRNTCSKAIERGKVNIQITTEKSLAQVKGATINTELLKSYYQQLMNVCKELNADAGHLLQTALTLPEVISYDDETANDEEWQVVEKTFFAALDQFNAFRKMEGENLNSDLLLRLKNIEDYHQKVIEITPNRITQIRERLQQFLTEFASQIKIDQNRFEQELIYYIDKLDVTEEQIRLQSHCKYFVDSLSKSDANGKKLGFIAQEMGREINTLGAKSNDAQMQQLVVGMKEELEKIKEQLLNVL